MAIASQKLVSRECNNRDIVYDEMVLIFFMNTIAKPHVKRLRKAFITRLQNTDSYQIIIFAYSIL